MTASIGSLARREFADGARSKLVWGVVLAALVLTLPRYYGTVTAPFTETVGAAQWRLGAPFAVGVGLLAVVVAAADAVREWRAGDATDGANAPASNGRALLAALLARTGQMGIAAGVAYLALGAVLVAGFGGLATSAYLLEAGLLAVYVLLWAALTVGVAAAVATRARAVVVLLGLNLLWNPMLGAWETLVLPAAHAVASTVAGPTPYVATGIRNPPPETPEWYLYAARLNPVRAYDAASYWISRGFATESGLLASGPSHNLFGVAVMLGWAGLALVVGYWRLRRCA